MKLTLNYSDYSHKKHINVITPINPGTNYLMCICFYYIIVGTSSGVGLAVASLMQMMNIFQFGSYGMILWTLYLNKY